MQLENAQAQTETARAPAATDGASGALAIPDDALIIVPVRNMVLFPGMILPITVGRDSSIAGAQQAVKAERPIGIVLQRDPEVDRPGLEDVFIASRPSPSLSAVASGSPSTRCCCAPLAKSI